MDIFTIILTMYLFINENVTNLLEEEVLEKIKEAEKMLVVISEREKREEEKEAEDENLAAKEKKKTIPAER